MAGAVAKAVERAEGEAGCGTVAGTYVGHGDYFNTLDEDTWTSFGGKILGTSAPRLAREMLASQLA